MGLKINWAQFVGSFVNLGQLPEGELPEIALVGRSNVGKSSLINKLVNRRNLAKSSSTPGKTRTINYYLIDEQWYLVDLPGYGYAKVPEALRKHWQTTLAAYLSDRPTLNALVLVMDCRHPLTPLDRQMLDWFGHSGRPVHVLLTKSDKLSRNAANQTLLAVRKELNEHWDNCTVQLFSSLKKQGVEEAEKIIGAWLNPNENQVPDPMP